MDEIIVYGADWCGDCRRAKQWFERNEIGYTWVDLVKHPDEIEMVIRYNEGRKNNPCCRVPRRVASHRAEGRRSGGEMPVRFNPLWRLNC